MKIIKSCRDLHKFSIGKIFLSVLSVGFEMASYNFPESSGQLNNAIMIVKENNIIVDNDFVVIVDLDPTGQTAQNCRFNHVSVQSF